MVAGEVQVARDDNQWARWLDEAKIRDVRWQWRHLERWATAQAGEPMGLRWQGERISCLYPLIRLPLDDLPAGTGRSDVRTPYDFGGPRFSSIPSSAHLLAFDQTYRDWLHSQGVVTEFARVDPMLADVVCHPAAARHGQHWIVELDDGLAEARMRYSRSFRRNLRIGKRSHAVAMHHTVAPDLARTFVAIYDETMARLDATSVYRFPAPALTSLLGDVDSRLIVVRRDSTVVAASIALSGTDTLYYHLTGSSADADRGVGELVVDATVELASELGHRWVHLGGGGPSLSAFKKRAASRALPYHVVRRVVSEAAFAELCEASGVPRDAPAFPPYHRPGWRRELEHA